MTLTLEYEVTEADLRVAQAAAARHLSRGLAATWWLGKAIPLAIALASGAAVIGASEFLKLPGPVPASALAMMVGIVLMLALAWLQASLARRFHFRAYMDGAGPFPFSQTATLDVHALTMQSHLGTGIVPLHRMLSVAQEAAHVVVIFRQGLALAIPSAAFASDRDRADFLERIGKAASGRYT